MKTKKTNKIWAAAILFAVVSCALDPSQFGKVGLYDQKLGGKDSFTFYVNEDYIRDNEKSEIDEKNPLMTKAESSLLKRLLTKEGFCREAGFVITSRQEKIYDVTFAHLIEENYRAKPVAPRMYYGKCL